MVAIIRTAAIALFAVVAALLHTTTGAVDVEASAATLSVGRYFRPTGEQVSGFVETAAKYRRSPCPALNTLANHGHLPRNGQNITNAQAKEVIMRVFNIGEDFAQFMAGQLPVVFALNDIAKHGFIEHDASLSRADTNFGADPARATPALVADLLARARDGKLTLQDVASARKQRIQNSNSTNPAFTFGPSQVAISNAESGLLLRGLGGGNTEEISLANLYSFVVDERFPNAFTRAPTPIMFAEIRSTSAALAALQV